MNTTVYKWNWKEYYQKNKILISKQQQKSYLKNREKRLLYRKQYCIKNGLFKGVGTGNYIRTEETKKRLGFQKGFVPWNKDTKGLQVAWNKGTKSILKAWNKGLKGYLAKEKHYNWKGAPYKNKEFFNNWSRNRRHKLGISKKFIYKYGGTPNGIKKTSAEHMREWRKNNPEKAKFTHKKYKYLRKNAGELPIKRIQLVYEDNIKKYGTLTCYLCLKSIEFKTDSLEHKIPLSRGGTNEYSNLAIACCKCNSKKGKKTEEEYRKGIKIL